jgi:hypothetical protein
VKEVQNMDTWYTKGLGDGMTASIPSDQIKDAFLRSFQAEGMPLDMAVFTRLESEGRLHCEVMAYFSPAAREVAKAFDPQPCEKPSRKGLDLLAGDAYAWSVLFDERD